MGNETTQEKKLVGRVTHFFGKINVAAIELTQPLKIGDKIRIEGVTTHFEQHVDSMQVENESISEAQPGAHVGIKVKDKVRMGDHVYLLQ